MIAPASVMPRGLPYQPHGSMPSPIRPPVGPSRDTQVPVSARHFAMLVELAGDGVSIRATLSAALDSFFRSRHQFASRPARRRRRRGRRGGSDAREQRLALTARLFAEQDGRCAVCGKATQLVSAGPDGARLLRTETGAFLCCTACYAGARPRNAKPAKATGKAVEA